MGRRFWLAENRCQSVLFPRIVGEFHDKGKCCLMSITTSLKRQSIPNRGQASPASSPRGLPASGSRAVKDVQRNSERRPQSIARALSWPLDGCLRWTPLGYGVAVELRSLIRRIQFRSKRRYHVFGLDLGPFHQTASDGHLELNTRTRACTRDIESFVAARPWATMVDVEMYREAWVRGAAWGESNLGSCTREPEKT